MSLPLNVFYCCQFPSIQLLESLCATYPIACGDQIKFQQSIVLFDRNGTPRAEANPFEEEEWDEEANEALVDNGEPGVPVRALYDYEGAESDELSFKQGTVPVTKFAMWHMSVRFYQLVPYCFRGTF